MSLRRNLVAHWSLDETGGYRADDHGAGQLADNNTVGYSASGLIGNAADFVRANNEFLSSSRTDFGANAGDKDFTVSAWVKLDAKTTRVGIVSADMGSTGTYNRTWRLDYDFTTDRFRFLAFDNNDAVIGTVSATNLGSPSAGTWYHLVAWHSATDNQVGIQVNNGTADTASTTAAIGNNVGQVYIGTYQGNIDGAGAIDGLIDEVALWQRLLTSDEKTTLYASGSGYPWSSWYTDTALDPLHVANAAAVVAYDATKHTYQVDVSVTQTGRHAIGIMMAQTADGAEANLKIGGSLVETIELDTYTLSNLDGSYFEDGFTYDFTSTGTKTIRVEAVSDAFEILGVIVREPDSVSGLVEDQGAATHCEPLRCEYGGSVYRLHIEMYTGDVYLTKDGAIQGKVFDGVQRNERYHVGASLAVLSGGIAVLFAGHNYQGLLVRYLPGGSYASITSTYTAESSTYLTYCKTHVLADDRIAVLTRGGAANPGLDPLLILLSDVAEIDGTGASHTADFIFHGVGAVYPNAFEYYENAGTEVLACLFNSRKAPAYGDWGDIIACLFCPQEGTYGEWYSLDGDDATAQNALGTEATPRFDATMRDTETKDGAGIRIIGAFGSTGQRYCLSGLFKVTQWPSGATPAKGALLMVWTDADGTDLNSYNSGTVVRFAIQNEATRTVDSSFNELPALAELDLNTNSYRFDAAFAWEDDDPAGDAFLAITDRGWGLVGSASEAQYERCTPYWDWGAHEIVVLRIANPHTPASITFAEEDRAEVGSKLRAAFITRAGTNRFVYQTAENQLHFSHRQSVRKEIYLGTVSGFTGYWGINAAVA